MMQLIQILHCRKQTMVTFLISFQQPKRFYSLVYSTKKDATNTSTRQQCYGNSPTKKQGYWGPTNEYVELVGG